MITFKILNPFGSFSFNSIKSLSTSFFDKLEKPLPLNSPLIISIIACLVWTIIFILRYLVLIFGLNLLPKEDLLKKFKNNVHLIKGNSNKVLKKVDMSKIDYVFLDGGHEYGTVVNDLNNCIGAINNNGTILCDDYNLSYAPGVKKAIDEFVEQNNLKCEMHEIKNLLKQLVGNADGNNV